MLRTSAALLLGFWISSACSLEAGEPAGEAIPADAGLRLVAKIPMPQMKGTWDHLAADPKTGRLFLSAQEDHAVDVVDLKTNQPVHRISGFFNRPQGEYYVPDLDKLVVTNGKDGTCKFLKGDTYELLGSIQLSLGADMIEYDPQTKTLYVESGGTDSKRGPGKLTLIDAVSGERVGEIVTDFRAAAMAMEKDSPRLYVALPGANQIAVIDRETRAFVARFDVGGRPASMALDEKTHRLFVATRTFGNNPGPARFVVLDTASGKILASLDSTDATENMFFDAAHGRIYTSSLEGAIQIYRQIDPDHYKSVGRIAAPPHAGTSQFIPELNRFCVAISPHENQVSQVWVFEAIPSEPSRDGLVVQKARNKLVEERGKLSHYDPKMWDLGGLPDYKPAEEVSGTIRFWGNNYIADSNLAGYWEETFRHYHPQARFDLKGLKSPLVATSGLITGAADIAANRHITFSELEGFERMYSYDPLEITMARGSADVPGWMTTFCIFVNKANPLSQLTMRQLDGIFGTARDGGWEGTTWHPEAGRSASENIRTWGDLGLTGEWKDQPIHVYGLNLRYNNCDMFERAVFHGGDKWNENLREYANYSRPDGSLAIAANILMGDLDNDKFGIGWSGIQNSTAKTKPIALAAKDGGPYVPLTIQTVHDRSYPLAFDMFFYLNRKPGQPLDPKVREFIRFVLSRQGQEAVARDGKYLPLTADVVQQQLEKLE